MRLHGEKGRGWLADDINPGASSSGWFILLGRVNFIADLTHIWLSTPHSGKYLRLHRLGVKVSVNVSGAPERCDDN